MGTKNLQQSDEKTVFLDLNSIFEEREAESESLLAARRTVEEDPVMVPINDADEEKMEVAVPETAHQISSGLSFFVFCLPFFCFSDVDLSLFLQFVWIVSFIFMKFGSCVVFF